MVEIINVFTAVVSALLCDSKTHLISKFIIFFCAISNTAACEDICHAGKPRKMCFVPHS